MPHKLFNLLHAGLRSSATTRRCGGRGHRTSSISEGEVALVIGRAGRHISESAALGDIAALTLCNEGSIRDWLRHVTQGRHFDSGGSLSYTSEAQVADIRLTTRVNSETRNDDRSSLIFPFRYLISYILSFTMPAPCAMA